MSVSGPTTTKRITVKVLAAMKARNEPISMLTAYDYTFAGLLDEAKVDMLLVGDSVGNVFAGHDSTLPVTLDEMIYHTKAVVRATSRAMIVTDLPFLSYQISADDALRNAGRIMKESGTQAVKLEGGLVMAETISRLTAVGIPVMGHLGLTPQSIHQFGGYGVRAQDDDEATRLRADALALQDAGAFAIVLEKVPATLAAEVTAGLRIPTIGIGAGVGCDGQVLVMHDLLGLNEAFRPRFVRRYAELGQAVRTAAGAYVADVKARSFPDESESY